MTEQLGEHKQNTKIALAGLLTQVILAATLTWLGKWSGVLSLQTAGYAGMAGTLVWVWLALTQHLKALLQLQLASPEMSKELAPERAAGENDETDPDLDEAAEAARRIARTRVSLTVTHRIIAPLFSFVIAILFWWSNAQLLNNLLKQPAEPPVDPLRAFSLMAGWCILAFGATRFFVIMTRKAGGVHPLLPGVKYLVSLLWIGVLFLVCYAASHFGSQAPMRYVSLFVPAVMLLVAVEIILFLVLDHFRPRRKSEEGRPAFDSRLLGLLIRSEGMGQTLWEALDYQFGFEISSSWFLRLCARSAWVWLLLSAGTLILLSMIVVLEPEEQALLFRFGQIQGEPLGPGLHWKAPWLVDSVAIHDITGIRRIHVGSHRPEAPGGNIYRADVPILWSNLHGILEEELLVVAPSSDSLEVIGRLSAGDKTKPPSINLMGGDIFVEYRIADLKAFVLASHDTEKLFAQIAETEASRELYRYDIDALLGKGRLQAEKRLHQSLRKAVEDSALGIEVLKVGFAGTHPPRKVASAFHETIIARQERKTAIQDAESYAARVKIEAVGRLEQADALIRGIDEFEKGEDAETQKGFTRRRDRAEALLLAAGGRVGETMAQARGYRWWRENEERGKSERFVRELELLRIGPVMFPRWQFFSTLEQGLADARKFVLLSDRDDLILRFNFLDLPDALAKESAQKRIMSPPWNDFDDEETRTER